MRCFTSSAHREHIDDILSGAKRVLEVGKAANVVFPIPGLEPVANILLALIERVEEARSTHEALGALSREVAHLVTLIDDTKRQVQSRVNAYLPHDPKRRALEEGLGQSPRITDRTATFCATLNSLKDRADDLYRGPFFLRCFHSGRDAGILKELQDGVAKAIQYFTLECQVAIEATVDKILESLRVIERQVNTVKDIVLDAKVAQELEMEDRILEALPHADAGYRAAVNAAKNNYLEGTRQELFEELAVWVDGSQHALSGKSICILSGGAGTGKSTIASEFACRLEKCKTLGASFFFVRGIEDLASTRMFFPTIAYQLAHSQCAIRPHIVKAAREHLKHGKSQLMKLEAGNLVKGPLHHASAQAQAVFLIVDALDECTNQASDQIPQMLQLLTACVRDAAFPVRVFLTSRPEHLVEHSLAHCARDVHTISLHKLPRKTVDRDIGILLRHRLSHMPSSKALFDEHPDVVDRLVKRADGLFVYARTAMDFLASYPDDLEERVDMLLSDDQRAIALGPLDDLYLTVLESAFPPRDLEHYDRFRARVESALGCVALLRDYISPRVLQALTHVRCKDTKSVLYQLRAVVFFDENDMDTAFRPMHSTFPQFLIDGRRCTNRLYLVDAPKQHARLAEGCLRALLYLSRNPCNLPDPTVAKADLGAGGAGVDLESRVRECVPPHVQYACVHWATHLAPAVKSGRLLALLGEFAGTKMLVWIETLGYMGRLDAAEASLGAARDWLERPCRTRALLDEGRQLVVNHYREIDQCPDDVYGSSIRQDGYSPEDFADEPAGAHAHVGMGFV
ncbi:hypothetical protein C8Q80DRAFT_175748 [Daedaleopsis nitida]|nr:hypothetical protein C8Q80DRAFT_175748 [Daedaleopsis nitida]